MDMLWISNTQHIHIHLTHTPTDIRQFGQSGFKYLYDIGMNLFYVWLFDNLLLKTILQCISLKLCSISSFNTYSSDSSCRRNVKRMAKSWTSTKCTFECSGGIFAWPAFWDFSGTSFSLSDLGVLSWSLIMHMLRSRSRRVAIRPMAAHLELLHLLFLSSHTTPPWSPSTINPLTWPLLQIR